MSLLVLVLLLVAAAAGTATPCDLRARTQALYAALPTINVSSAAEYYSPSVVGLLQDNSGALSKCNMDQKYVGIPALVQYMNTVGTGFFNETTWFPTLPVFESPDLPNTTVLYIPGNDHYIMRNGVAGDEYSAISLVWDLDVCLVATQVEMLDTAWFAINACGGLPNPPTSASSRSSGSPGSVTTAGLAAATGGFVSPAAAIPATGSGAGGCDIHARTQALWAATPTLSMQNVGDYFSQDVVLFPQDNSHVLAGCGIPSVLSGLSGALAYMTGGSGYFNSTWYPVFPVLTSPDRVNTSLMYVPGYDYYDMKDGVTGTEYTYLNFEWDLDTCLAELVVEMLDTAWFGINACGAST